MQEFHLKNGELVLFEFNTERCTFTNLGIFNKNTSIVIFFHNTFRQRKAQAPTSFLGSETWCEDSTEMVLGNTLARIGYLDREAV